jgi:hemerythrin
MIVRARKDHREIVSSVTEDRAEAETETADRPDRISRISHRWMIRHFPGEMTEDARPVDVNRIPENMGNRKAPELSWQFRGLFCLKD